MTTVAASSWARPCSGSSGAAAKEGAAFETRIGARSGRECERQRAATRPRTTALTFETAAAHDDHAKRAELNVCPKARTTTPEPVTGAPVPPRQPRTPQQAATAS